ncbi:hypothetical protein V8G54_034074, partial [Vigna mungo]
MSCPINFQGTQTCIYLFPCSFFRNSHILKRQKSLLKMGPGGPGPGGPPGWGPSGPSGPGFFGGFCDLVNSWTALGARLAHPEAHSAHLGLHEFPSCHRFQCLSSM